MRFQLRLKDKRAIVRLKGLGVNTRNKVYEIMEKKAIKMRTIALKEMQGTPRAAWFYIRGKGRNRKKHYPSAIGYYPAIDGGDLAKSLTVDSRQKKIIFGATIGAPYSRHLEDGTRKMKPRPWLEPTADKILPEMRSDIKKAILESVRG